MRVEDKSYTKESPFDYNKDVQAYCSKKGDCMANQTNSLAHTKWVCKYHVVFTPK
jgi:putative transposase